MPTGGGGGGGGGSGSQKLQLGMFTVSHPPGLIGIKGSITVTIDCVAEAAGKCEEVSWEFKLSHFNCNYFTKYIIF